MKKRKLPGPSAHRKECWSDMLKMAPDAKEYVCNGHFMIKTDKVPKRSQKTGGYRTVTLKQLMSIMNKPTKPAQLKYYAFLDPDVGEGVSLEPIGVSPYSGFGNVNVIFEARWWENSMRSGAYTEMVERLEVKQGYFNIVRNRYPDAQYGLGEDTQQLTVFNNSEAIGVIMAIYSGNTGVSCYDMAREMGYIE